MSHKIHSRTCLAIMAALAVGGCGYNKASPSFTREAWGHTDRPGLLGDFDHVFANLPTEAKASVVPWTGPYWPNNERGLAWRWQDGDDSSRKPSLESLREMDQEDIDKLSPAEKYDILRGDYSYRFTSSELKRTSPRDPDWFGLCHGFAPASFNFQEPGTVTTRNEDGIELTFYSTDMKGLLSYAQQAPGLDQATRFLGTRCEPGERCIFPNAGSFHISLANTVGKSRTPMVLDISKNYEIWNHPVYAYESVVEREHGDVYPGAADGTVKIVDMQTTIHFIAPVDGSRDTIGTSDVGQFEDRTLRYQLELDASGEIIGGRWKGNSGTGFIWSQTRPNLTGYFSNLAALYDQSIRE